MVEISEHPHRLAVLIPFATWRQASIAVSALSPDPQLRPDQFVQVLSISGRHDDDIKNNKDDDIQTGLLAQFEAASERVLRVGVNGFFESLGVVIGCLNELDEV
ncbi:CTAG/Pcc1 family [Lipomyces japonicus]|uniref:CTAG/Pcc1 family n=1 Tax=Lipomyces japonicus TaxID=56871 RepID=UPI0034CEAEAE